MAAAAVTKISSSGLIFRRTPFIGSYFASRNFAAKSDGPPRGSVSDSDDYVEKNQGWFSRLLPVRKIDPGSESHSSLLADKETVYEMQMHSVKPECMEKYLGEYLTFVNRVHAKNTGATLAGSWTVEIGDQDEAIHLWKYEGGYPTLNNATRIYRTDQEFVDFRLSRNQMLRSRCNQILLAFSFWGDPKPREGSNIYELRSYVLKPGTMIEWGNNWVVPSLIQVTCRWFSGDEKKDGTDTNSGRLREFSSAAKGIKYRQDKDEAVAGFFSHIGELYNVHHLWAYETLQDRKKIRENVWSTPGWDSVVSHTAYESLESRKETREAAWRRPGWDACVAHTVPLIRHMTARILVPTPFSPLQ